MVIEIAAGVLVAVLGLFSVAALAIGVLAAFGALRLARCSQCGHMVAVSGNGAAPACPYCRHERTVHLFATMHHPRTGHHHLPPGSVG